MLFSKAIISYCHGGGCLGVTTEEQNDDHPPDFINVVHHHTVKMEYEETKNDEGGKQDENVVTTEITTDEEAISLTKEFNQIVQRLEEISSIFFKNKEKNHNNSGNNNSSNNTTMKDNFIEQENQFLKLEAKWNMERLSIIKSKLLLFTKQSTAVNAPTTNEINNDDCNKFKRMNTETSLMGEPSMIVTPSKQEPYTDSHPDNRCFKNNKLIVMEDDQTCPVEVSFSEDGITLESANAEFMKGFDSSFIKQVGSNDDSFELSVDKCNFKVDVATLSSEETYFEVDTVAVTSIEEALAAYEIVSQKISTSSFLEEQDEDENKNKNEYDVSNPTPIADDDDELENKETSSVLDVLEPKRNHRVTCSQHRSSRCRRLLRHRRDVNNRIFHVEQKYMNSATTY
ncbi:MAG: hypothetical protein ACI8RD_009902 [Bacillariaceae sp.]|jgi:hypothetical protein